MSNDKWIRVTKANPCPVCERPDWCMISADGTAAICQRTESEKKCGNAGWLHKLSDPIPTKRIKRKPVKQEPPKDFFALHRKYSKNLVMPRVLSKELGVSVDSLLRLEIGWDGKHYTFPRRDANDKIIGLSIRARNGKKWAVAGSKNALLIPTGIKRESKNCLWICEGPSDLAALLDLGFDAIGRVTCNSGVEYVLEYIKGYDREVIIMTDRDEFKKRPDGSKYKPGIDGAYALAKVIKPVTRSLKIVRPKAKDIRQWYNNGATKAQVIRVANMTRFI